MPLQLVGQEADFKFESTAGHDGHLAHSHMQFQKTVEGVDGKINDRAHGAALLLSSDGLNTGRVRLQITVTQPRAAAWRTGFQPA